MTHRKEKNMQISLEKGFYKYVYKELLQHNDKKKQITQLKKWVSDLNNHLSTEFMNLCLHNE